MVNTSVKCQSRNFATTLLIGCVLLAAILCYVQIRGMRSFISACLIFFLLFFLWACWENKVISVLLFFLPWSPLLKLYNGGISFFTIALLIACLFYFWKNGLKFDLYQVILVMLLLGFTLTGKILQDNSIANNYICFFAMLLFFPSVIKGSKNESSFMELTIFFACGIITTALSAQQLAIYPNISQYIKVDSYLTITRMSGYYGDPNFYSAQITACLAGIMILLICEKKRLYQFILLIIGAILLYCGFLSASKSFVVVLTCLLIVWIPLMLEKSIQKRTIGLIAGIICVCVIILSLPEFQDLLRIVEDRFSYASNMSELTTGRTELWSSYIDELLLNIPLLLLGEGYSSVNLYGCASHNTIIQGIYQFGIIGLPVFLMWMFYQLKIIVKGTPVTKNNLKYIVLMCIGIILPWMALDILFFDEIFILPAYGIIGGMYASQDYKRALSC